MTETKPQYHAPPNGRGIAWLTSRQVSAIVFAELRDLLDDAANRMPPDVGHMDTDRLTALRDDLSRALACTYRLEDAIAQMERCEEAARAYDDAALRYFGEFARTNAMIGGAK